MRVPRRTALRAGWLRESRRESRLASLLLWALASCGLLGGLAGCFLFPRTAPPATGAGGASALPMFRSGPASPWQAERRTPVPAEPAYGTLRLTIHWPGGPGRDLRGYHAQLIPNSAARIDVRVLGGTALLATASVLRAVDQPAAVASFRLEAANNLRVEADAFAEVPAGATIPDDLPTPIPPPETPTPPPTPEPTAEPTPDPTPPPETPAPPPETPPPPPPAVEETPAPAPVGWGYRIGSVDDPTPTPAPFRLVALGSAGGITVGKSQETGADVVMTSLFAPRITALSFAAGRPGDQLQLWGANLAAPWAPEPAVWFTATDGTRSARITAVASGSLRLEVPASASVGPIQVVADGVPSDRATVFWVGRDCALTAPRATWDTAPPDTRMVLFEDTLSLTATYSWVLPGGRAASDFGTAPVASWSLAPVPGLGSILNVPGPANTFTAGTTAGQTAVVGLLGGSLYSNVLQLRVAPLGPFAAVGSLPRGRVARGTSFWNRIWLVGGAGEADVWRAGLGGFPPALGPFEPWGVSLGSARDPALALVGGQLFALGGRGASASSDLVEAATLDENGNLRSFAAAGTTLARPGGDNALPVGRYLYVFGTGPDGRGVDRAPVDANGDLGSFEAAPGLTEDRRLATAFVAEPYVYLVGGSGSGYLATVERAPILDLDGNLGPFARHGEAMRTGRAGHAGVRVGDAYLVLGGQTASGTSKGVERAAIDGAGVLGRFEALQTGMVRARETFTAAVLGDYLYVAGGRDGACNCEPLEVERAAVPVVGDGDLDVGVR